ncbi:hypothetical protein [Nonomuraea sp. NPDC049129]|uniref:hypothetical protein n=1 Tax=Nonomuraea sp. NPDC049129 TaxID=3155272 RepID=UPI0033D1B387
MPGPGPPKGEIPSSGSGPADVPQVVVEYVAHDDPAGQSLRVGGDVVAYGEQVNQLRGRAQGLLAFFR